MTGLCNGLGDWLLYRRLNVCLSDCLLFRYANENRHENAVKDFQEALKLNPKHKNARKYLAETQATRGNRQD